MIILEEIINVDAIKGIFLTLLCTLILNKNIMGELLLAPLLETFLQGEEEGDLKKSKAMTKILKKHLSMVKIMKTLLMAMK